MRMVEWNGHFSIRPVLGRPVRPGKVVHLKRWTSFLETFWLDRTDPLMFGPEFLVEWFASYDYVAICGLCIGQIESPTCPPRATPRHLTFLKIIVQIPPYPGQNAAQMPHTGVHSGDQMPPPRGQLTGTKMTEGRRKRLQSSNKIFINIAKTEKHC